MRGRNSYLQGFRQEKWFHIYRVVNSYKVAVLAIQEAHLTDELAANINTAFETKISVYHSPLPETRNAAGVAFVINKGLLNAEKVTYEEIIPGRAIIAKIKWHGDATIKILNIYAPNDTAENEAFWDKLRDATTRKPEWKPDILLGDFNVVEDSLDRLPCHPDNAGAVAALGELKSHLNLIDGWRRTHPDKREYSHTQSSNTSQSRIDRIYITNELLAPATDWKIDPPLIETDHWLVSTNVTTPEAPEIGRGRWQIPTYLLENETVMNDLNTLGRKTLDKIETNKYRRTNTVNPQTIYASFKTDLVETCRKHAKVIHPTITNKIAKLKKKLISMNNN
ncbi:Endonuclease/exonuclease/phosphatase, partial [Thelephora terrestris]